MSITQKVKFKKLTKSAVVFANEDFPSLYIPKTILSKLVDEFREEFPLDTNKIRTLSITITLEKENFYA